MVGVSVLSPREGEIMIPMDEVAAATVERPAPTALPPRQRRWVRAVVLVLVAASLGLFAIVAIGLIDGDSGSSELPAEAERVLEDFEAAAESEDADLFRSIITDDYFFAEDFYMPDGTDPDFSAAGPFSVSRIEWSTYQVERFGDAIVAGDGPWMVSIGEIWTDEFNRWDGTATYVLVDDAGQIKVNSYDWIGVKVPVQPDFTS